MRSENIYTQKSSQLEKEMDRRTNVCGEEEMKEEEERQGDGVKRKGMNKE